MMVVALSGAAFTSYCNFRTKYFLLKSTVIAEIFGSSVGCNINAGFLRSRRLPLDIDETAKPSPKAPGEGLEPSSPEGHQLARLH